MEEGHLHVLAAVLNALEEDAPALDEASEGTLNQPAAPLNFLVVPLNLEHPPVLLDVDCCLPLLVPPLLGLTGPLRQLSTYLTAR